MTMWRRGRWGRLIGVLLGLAMSVSAVSARAEVMRTHVDDTVYAADGSVAHGTVLISWPAFTTAGGQTVAKGSTSVTLTESGELSVMLAPNVGANPTNTYYTAVFHLSDGTVSREFWVIPVSANNVTLQSLRASVLPTSTAMQTVSKQYVDQAIAKALVDGVTDDPANPYVQKGGDTMTGPLLLSGDPTAAQQASTKNYVDTNVAAVQAGLGQKVALSPAAAQTVVQPENTEMQVNRLNGVLNVGTFKSNSNLIDGVANTVATPECQTAGCEMVIEHGYSDIHDGFDTPLPKRTHGVDHRGGMQFDYFVNPYNKYMSGQDAAEKITLIETESSPEKKAVSGTQSPHTYGLWIDQRALAGGSNIFPERFTSTTPYFKSTYTALNVQGTYNTQGQHILMGETSHCYAVGDCLLSGKFLYGAGGYRDSADEGIHPSDFHVSEELSIFQGVCSTGCTTGSTQMKINATRDAGTQGDGRFLIDTNPGKVLSGGAIVGGDAKGSPNPTAIFSGTNFPISTMFELTDNIYPQESKMEPGIVTSAIVTSGVPTGYSTSTVAAPAASGVACVSDLVPGDSFQPVNYEMANYTVVDGTHLQLDFHKPHAALATVSIGGLCGYGVEQTVDTGQGMRQVFPIIGSYSPTELYYAAAKTPILGQPYQTGGYLNVSLAIASIARSNGTVTVTTASNMPANLNGLQLTVAGVTDPSYNGTFTVTTTAANTFTYAQSGANGTSSSGTIGILTGGYKMYPMAEVLSVMNASTQKVDGTMTLAPNTVAWEPNDTVEQPHYYQVRVGGEHMFIWQQTPRPLLSHEMGIEYQNTAGPDVTGWTVDNTVPNSYYFGMGGTHAPPKAGMRIGGVWNNDMQLTAGESNTFYVLCKTGGCDKWNSAYNLFALQNTAGNGGADYVTFDPVASRLSFNMRGGVSSISPNTITTGTMNASTVTGGTAAFTGAVSMTRSSAGQMMSGTDNSGSGFSFSTDSAGRATAQVTGNAVGGANGGAYFNATGYQESFFQLKTTSNSSGLVNMRFGNQSNKFVVQHLNDAASAVVATPFVVNNGAPDNSIVVGSSGGVSVGTSSDAGNGNLLVNGSVKAGTALVSKVQSIAWSTTPTFSVNGNANRIVLTGNVTSSTIAAGQDGQRMCMNLVQDATGGRTFVWPTNMLGAMTVGSVAGKRNQQCFVYYSADSAWVAESAGVVNQ